ncbi:hypothetical protein Tco_0476040 [Tanacetum coccineum]
MAAVAGQPWQWCWCRWEAEMRDGVVLSGDCYDGCCGEGGGGEMVTMASGGAWLRDVAVYYHFAISTFPG